MLPSSTNFTQHVSRMYFESPFNDNPNLGGKEDIRISRKPAARVSANDGARFVFTNCDQLM